MTPLYSNHDLIDLEIRLLLEAVYQSSGFDFRGYDAHYTRPKALRFVAGEGLETVSQLQDRLLRSPDSMKRFIESLAIGVASFFSEPRFFSSFRSRIADALRRVGGPRIWTAGCACGAETYSVAITLKEENMQKEVRLYATQMCEDVLASEKAGLVPAAAAKGTARKYKSAGGKKRLADYYSVRGTSVLLQPSLRCNITWAQHNLITDASFNQFHCVICRNVIGCFSEPLKEQVHRLVYDSLTIGGFIGVSSEEDMQSTRYSKCYQAVDGWGQWYRKVV